MTHTEKLNYNRIKMLERELNKIYDGIRIRSKAKWIENGEKTQMT